MEHVEAILDQVSSTLAELAQSDVVVGSPLELGGVTIVPISRVAAGFGGGGGQGSGDARGKSGGSDQGKGSGAGSAGAAKVRPVALAVFSADGVEILSIAEQQGKLEKLLDQIPDLMERLKKSVDK